MKEEEKVYVCPECGSKLRKLDPYRNIIDDMLRRFYPVDVQDKVMMCDNCRITWQVEE